VKRLLALVLVSYCLGSMADSAYAQYRIAETRSIDKTFHVITLHLRNSIFGQYEVRNYFKAVEHDGHLAVCGGYTGGLTAQAASSYSDALRNLSAHVIVGARDDAAAPRIHPLGFMTANMSPDKPLETMSAACVRTKYEWKPEYATRGFSLSLH